MHELQMMGVKKRSNAEDEEGKPKKKVKKEDIVEIE